ncbi:MAG: thioesterase family protein [Candidatus Eisenbacteria bacterium]
MSRARSRATEAPPPGAHAYEIQVRYGDTDQMRVAYHANYLHWFEIARTEWLRAHGKSYRELEAEGVILPVTEAHCRYLASALYDDRLRLWGWVGELGRATVQFDYRIERVEDERLIAVGYTRHCFLDRDGRPVRIEGSLHDLLAQGLPAATPPPR